jgi:glycosyltransferase involved in cell wall biosynthesis
MSPEVIILQDQLRGGGTERQSCLLARALIQAGIPTQLQLRRSGGPLMETARQQLQASLKVPTMPPYLHELQLLYSLSSRKASAPRILIGMGRWGNSLLGLLPQRAYTHRIATVRTSRPLPLLYRRAIRQADKVIANSHWALRYAFNSSRCQALAKGSVLHNGLSRPSLLHVDPPAKQAARQKLQIAADSCVLLSVARLESGKGQADLLQALARLRSHKCQLILLGEGPRMQSLKKICQELDISQQVQFVGFTESTELYYAAADLFVSASTLDSLPNALIEAQAAGLPIVAYATAGVPEIIDHNRNGYLIEPRQLTAFAEHIQQLIKNPATRHTMGQAARQSAQKKFGPDQQMQALIQQVLNL